VMLAIANGTFHSAVLFPHVGEQAGHVISTLALSLLILLTAWFTIGWIRPATLAAAVLVGFLWLSLTLMFEFGVGYYLFHRPWEHLIADYNLARGRVLILVLLVTLKAPFLAATARVLLRP